MTAGKERNREEENVSCSQESEGQSGGDQAVGRLCFPLPRVFDFTLMYSLSISLQFDDGNCGTKGATLSPLESGSAFLALMPTMPIRSSILSCIYLSGRTAKEHASYEQEIVSQTEKIEKMKAENKDFHDIKQQVAESILQPPRMSSESLSLSFIPWKRTF